MRWAYFTAITITLIHISGFIQAQKVVTTVATPIDYGIRCEGDTIEMGFYSGISCYRRKTGVCSSPFPDEFEDRSNEIQLSGPNSPKLYKLKDEIDGTNKAIINIMGVSIVAKESGEIKVTSRSLIEFVVGNTCPNDPPESYIWERIWTYKVRVVPKPPTPSLDVERYISPGSEGIRLIASGCPTTHIEYNYEYQWNNVICLKDTNNFFSRNHKLDGTYSGDGGRYYRVRCAALNGTCTSRPSKFERGITYNPPSDDCIPDEYASQITKIENIKNISGTGNLPDPTYHYFPVQTEICNMSVDANCSVSNVFNTMKSENQFITPIPSDLPGIDFFDIDKNYAPKNKGVKSCEIVNLPALLGESVIKLFQYPPVFALSNPVMTYIDESNKIVINYTLKDHIFSPGRIIRKVMQICDIVYILTIGEGLNDINREVGWINKDNGPDLFRNVDARTKKRYEEIYKK